MSDYDAAEEAFHPTQECYECSCGEDLSQANPPEFCACEKSCCGKCKHECEWCGQGGCEDCMVDGVDGWVHKHKCENAIATHAQKQDKLANDAVLNIVVGRMIDSVMVTP